MPRLEPNINVLSEYEKLRQQNIEEKRKFLESLGVVELKHEIQNAYGKKQPKLKLKSRIKNVPTRRSDRLRNKPAETFPPDYISIVEEDKVCRKEPLLKFSNSCLNELEQKSLEEILQNLKVHISEKRSKPQSQETKHELKQFIKDLKMLELSEEGVKKVVPDRIFSLCWTPSNDSKILFAGDKWGKIGIWNLDIKKDDEQVIVLYPHTSPVCHLAFPSSRPEALYSCSYDGSVRMGDLNKQEFTEVYSTPIEDNNLCKSFDFLTPGGESFLVAQQDGTVALVDTRSHSNLKGAQRLYNCTNRSLRTLQTHPQNKNLFITSSSDGLANIWDLRSMQDINGSQITKATPKSVPVTSLVHGAGVYSAYFSPHTGHKVVTVCLDDYVRVWDITLTSTTAHSPKLKHKLDRHNSHIKKEIDASSLSGNESFHSAEERLNDDGPLQGTSDCSAKISHYNHVGRWLSNFKARWHPKYEDIFIVGSMNRPRRVQVFSSAGDLVHEFISENLNSVTSLNEFHPHLNIFAGGNSSGRCFVWS